MGALRALADVAVSFKTAEVLVLCFHRIRSRARFTVQMTVLTEHGYSALSMGQFIEWLGGYTPHHGLRCC